MKRIDEKIQEIEKKDKRSRGLYIAFVILIIGFMGAVLFFQSKLAEKNKQIDEADILNSELYIDLDKEKTLSEERLYELESSLRPEKYWEHIKDENSVEAYIEYLTNVWGIRRDSIDINSALSNIKLNNTTGEIGWLYIGNETDNGPYVQPTKGQVAQIIWRRGQEKENQIASIESTKPKEYDIIKLVKTINRTTYKGANFNSGTKKEGWRPSSRAFISEIKKNQAEVWVKIRYY